MNIPRDGDTKAANTNVRKSAKKFLLIIQYGFYFLV